MIVVSQLVVEPGSGRASHPRPSSQQSFSKNLSATLRNNCNPSKSKAIGVFDAPDLWKRRAENIQSNHILHGGKQRKKVADAPVTNAQLRDKAVCFPEAKAQRHLKKRWSFVPELLTDENSPDISAHCEAALTPVSSAYTPDEPGKPRTEARLTAKVFSIFARDRPGFVVQYEPLALRRPWIANSLEKACRIQLILRTWWWMAWRNLFH